MDSKRDTERFIVTGGAGFIGANLVKALNRRGCGNVIIVDRLDHPAKAMNLTRIDFEDYFDKAVFRHMLAAGDVPGVDGVFHLGACSSTTETDERYLRENNVEYSRALCEWALRTGARFVYASSAATYGDGSRGFSDDDAVTPLLEPLNPYGRSKQAFDRWALDTGAFKDVAGVKYFNVYGPWEDHKGDMRSMVHKAYRQVRREGGLTLFRSHRPECRDGEQARDFVYVDDAVAVTLFLYDHPEANGLFNCGTGRARTWLDMADALFNAMGFVPEIRFVDMPADIRERYQYHTRADTGKLRSAGYAAPFIGIEDGVARYVRKHLNVLSAADEPADGSE